MEPSGLKVVSLSAIDSSSLSVLGGSVNPAACSSFLL